MGDFVNRDVVLHIAIPVRAGVGPNVHAACAGLTVGRGGKVGVVRSRAEVRVRPQLYEEQQKKMNEPVLHRHQDTIVRRASLAKVVCLEVVRGLSETVKVEDIVVGVDDVERVDARSVHVVRGGRGTARAVSVVETRGDCGLRRLVRNDVVATKKRIQLVIM